MGRLTLNVLLSFAQFEREVTSERIRDKIAASKKKGMWMGGMVPMGYLPDPDPNVRGLLICEAEAECIRRIYDLYDECEDLAGVAKQIALEGIRSKRREFKSGQEYGGCALSHGQVHFILTNPIYIGCIRHHNEIYEGLHQAIIDRNLWDRVQSKLQTNAAKPRTRNKKFGNLQAPRNASPLRGKIYDEGGDRLTPTHTKLGSRQVRYYVSNRLLKKQTGDNKDPSGWRLPAVELEKQVAKTIVGSVRDNYARFLAEPDPVKEYRAQRAGRSWIKKLKIQDADFLRSIVARIDVEPGKIKIKLAANEMASSLGLGANAIDPAACEIYTKFQLKRRGVEAKLVCGELEPTPDKTLIRTMAKAHAWLKEIRQGISAAEIGRRHGWTDSPIRQRLKMAFLSPRITELILAGKQPPDLTLQKILTNPLPLDWDSQWTALGFDQIPH